MLRSLGEVMARWRLGARLRQQDWAAVAIDLAIVVVGVFLGIQASNWNDERKDRQLSHEYLRRIAGDLHYDVQELGDRQEFWKASADAGDRALRFAEDHQQVRSDWDTLLDFYEAGQIENYGVNDGTYREMLSAGRLDLIRDNRLKADLSDYYVVQRGQAHDLFDTLPPYREDIRGAIPYRFQRYILDHCYSEDLTGRNAGRCAPPPDDSGLATALQALASNPKLISELRTWMTTLHYTRGVGGNNQQFAKGLIKRIDQDL